MPRSDRPSNIPGTPPRRVRRRPGASRSSMLATPLCLSFVSVAAMMLVRLIMVWNGLYTTPSILGTVVDHGEQAGRHWLTVRWTEGDSVREALDLVSDRDYTTVRVGAPVEIVATTPPTYLYPGHYRAARLWPLASMAAFWIVVGGFVIYHVALPALRQRWLVRYGVAVSGELVDVSRKGEVATLSYRYQPTASAELTGRMMVLSSVADRVQSLQRVSVLHARNPRSSVLYEATDYEIL